MAKKINHESDLDGFDPETSMIAKPGTVRYEKKAAQHTPGPWKVSSDPYCRPGANSVVADVISIAHGLASSNAHLIAAAPEMLAVLQDCLPYITACAQEQGDRDDCDDSIILERSIRQAIAKAQGGKP